MTATVPLADLFTTEDWFALLDVSLTGIHLVRPVYEPDGPAIVDFAIEYLNPAGQRMTGLVEQPGGTLLGRFPHALSEGIFQYYRRVFETGEQLTYQTNYQADGLDNFFKFSARRSGAHLLVSFTDTSDQSRSAVELALRESQAAERAARAESEVQRQRFYEVLMQLPAHVAIHQGPDQVFTLVNPGYQRIAHGRDLLGQPIREAWPELTSHGILDVLDQVYRTGEPFSATELPVQADFARTGQLEQVYYNFFFQALRDGQGHITGVLNFSYDVTEQVRARQQVEQLNQELETRVQARTRELAQAQAEAEIQRQRLHQLVAEAPALIAGLRGPAHVVELANEGFRAIFGGRDLVGKPYRAAIPEFEGQPFFDRLDAVYRTGQTYYGIDEPVTLDRTNSGRLEQTYITYTYQATRDAQGRIDGILVFCYEVTDQVLARQEREQQRRLLYDLFMQAPAAICILAGPELVYELVNPGYQALFPGRALLDRRLLDALPEIAGHAVHRGFREVYDTGVTLEEQALLIPLARPEDGELEDRYFNYIQQARRDAQGRIDGVLVFAFEVTEQVRARQASEASARQLRDITDALPVLIGYLDREEKYRFANEAYRAWFQQDPAALLGQPIRQVAGAAAYQNIRDYVARALAGERVDFEADMPFRPGFAKFIRTTYVPDVQRGQVVGCYTLVFDITEQTEARQQVNALNEELTATNQELYESNAQLTRTNVDLDTFVYTASHDLKAPITNIEGIVLALRDTLPPEVQQNEMVAHLLGLLDQTVARFQLTITQLTDISRLQLAHTEPAEPVGLARVVEDVRLDLAPALAAAGTQLTVAVAPELLVSFSPANLRSIVYNLLSNAVKYRAFDRPSQVRVHAEPGPHTLVLTVQDNGLGMSEVQQRQLFGLFQRLHTHVEGTGVGLYITKRLIENAGGTIQVQSQPNVGTTFTVTFPA